VTHLSKLVAHSVWANEQWISFLADRFSFDEFLMKRMAHILLGEGAWFQRVGGQEPDPDIWRLMSVVELREMHETHKNIYDECLRGSLDRIIAYKRFTGEEYQSPVADILLHLTLHGAHHRGQMATYVSSTGTKPINTDFVQWCLLHGV
jgi:uncharacterized damage-inducible protein DinB